ncbi:hypothetical protein LIER_30694 [Lithospermum erythrorhizon]|uniref:ATP-dependent DNA helicase n=1 Tax=Lithospermum erythrorhizon TaxID=34254 RepID=A0AAV3RSJ2_LITER
MPGGYLHTKLFGGYMDFHLVGCIHLSFNYKYTCRINIIRFEDDADLDALMMDERSKRSMLTEFFNMNSSDPDAQHLNCLYKNFPSRYVWDSTKRDSDIVHRLLLRINDTLKSFGKEVDDYHIVPCSFVPTDSEELTREVSAELSLPVLDIDLHTLDELNIEQRGAFNILFDKAMAGEGGSFFVDGPSGTGKSFFLYKVLLANIRSKGFIALVVATSGIASFCFLEGRTAHSRFKIPIDITSIVKCQVSYQSGDAY